MASSRTEIQTEHASVDQRVPHKEDSGSETQSNAPNIGKISVTLKYGNMLTQSIELWCERILDLIIEV